MPDESVDLLVTDPPYGLHFMGKNWDKDVPPVEIWKECMRVLKPGAFAFIMCSPRQDRLHRMIGNLRDAGFETGFTSIYWAYATGFTKAQNIGKAVDKRLGVKRKVITKIPMTIGIGGNSKRIGSEKVIDNPATPQAKTLDGSYAGFQPKPAIEVILVCMKPLSEKTFVDQALKNRKGITWLNDCRMPTREEAQKQSDSKTTSQVFNRTGGKIYPKHLGRFPANLLVSDDVLNDGRVTKSYSRPRVRGGATQFHRAIPNQLKLQPSDSGPFSRYFDLDKWAQRTFPFLIVPKASKVEKNRGCEELYWEKDDSLIGYHQIDRKRWEWLAKKEARIYQRTGKQVSLKAEGNVHVTVKPLKIMAYLITLGSREGDVMLDPFVGTGTSCIAGRELGHDYIGIDTEQEHVKIAKCRLKAAATRISCKKRRGG